MPLQVVIYRYSILKQHIKTRWFHFIKFKYHSSLHDAVAQVSYQRVQHWKGQVFESGDGYILKSLFIFLLKNAHAWWCKVTPTQVVIYRCAILKQHIKGRWFHFIKFKYQSSLHDAVAQVSEQRFQYWKGQVFESRERYILKSLFIFLLKCVFACVVV